QDEPVVDVLPGPGGYGDPPRVGGVGGDQGGVDPISGQVVVGELGSEQVRADRTAQTIERSERERDEKSPHGHPPTEPDRSPRQPAKEREQRNAPSHQDQQGACTSGGEAIGQPADEEKENAAPEKEEERPARARMTAAEYA